MKDFLRNFALAVLAAFLAIAIGIFIIESVGYPVGAPFVTGSDPVGDQVMVGHQKSSEKYLAELNISREDHLRFKLEAGSWLISILLALAFVVARSRLLAILVCSLFAATIIYLEGAEHAAVGVGLAGVVAGAINWYLFKSVRLRGLS